MRESIRIYIADLAAYNNGKLHGVWIDCTDDVDTIQDQLTAMLATSPQGYAEEYAIHDYEGFGDCRLSEYQDLETILKIAKFIHEYSDFAAGLLSHLDGNLDDAKKAAQDQYCGYFRSLADYAQELTESATELPKQVASYIDYERMGRDMELSGDVFTLEAVSGEVHVFWSF